MYIKKYNILITGGAGYIGSILTPLLLADDHKVTVIDNYKYNQCSLTTSIINKNFNLIKEDCRNISVLKAIIKDFDVIIPLAAYVGAPLCNKDPWAASSINKESIVSLFKLLSKKQLILMPTTNSAYGSGGKDNYCDENTKLNPLSLYAREKVEIEKILMERENSVSFRLATVFGMSPRMRLDLLINDFTYKAINDKSIVLFEPHFKRNFIHVRDVADVFNLAIKNPDNFIGNIFNVGLSDANLSKYELCKLIKNFLPSFEIYKSGTGKDPDQRNYLVSNKKIEKAGFNPKISIEEGIQELIKGLKIFNTKIFTNLY
jgi:nucleoside-diphosphate-sugar epimerase